MKWSTLVESGKGVVSNATKVISRNRVSILVGLGTMSTITAIVTAVRATPKAMNAIEDKRVEVNRYELTNKETICATAKYYIPTVLSTAAAVTCFATAVNFSDKKAAAATLAATTAQISLDEYRAQAKQAWGEEGAKKDAEIMNAIAAKQVEQTYSKAVPQNEKLDGDVLCLDRQTSYDGPLCNWITNKFLPWMISLPCDRVIFIPGNHDFITEHDWFKQWFNTQLEVMDKNYPGTNEDNKPSRKIVYLCYDLYEYKGYKFYGCPTSDIINWAWSANNDYTKLKIVVISYLKVMK